MDWTLTEETSVVLDELPAGDALFLSVKSSNPFGYWSNASSTVLAVRCTIGEAMEYGDGTAVEVTGVVTAVYSDCCYIQQPYRGRGIKWQGDVSDFDEGDDVSVGGALITTDGERAIVVD